MVARSFSEVQPASYLAIRVFSNGAETPGFLLSDRSKQRKTHNAGQDSMRSPEYVCGDPES